MSSSIFEPAAVRATLKNRFSTQDARNKFESEWEHSVSAERRRKKHSQLILVQVRQRLKSWERNRKHQSSVKAQLSWEAEVVEYVSFVHKLTSVHGNKKGAAPPALQKEVPILGPHFLPPGYIHAQKRDAKITPDISYIRALTVVHPFYFPTISQCCPSCNSSDTLLEGWTTKGARDVHGLLRDERAIGVQIICKHCRGQYEKGGPQEGKGHFCFATTAKCFWAKWEHWRIPSELHNLSQKKNLHLPCLEFIC